MHEELLNPEKLNDLAKKIHATGQLGKVNAIFGFGIEGELLASALCSIYKKPSLSKEIIERIGMNRFPEEITLLPVAYDIDIPITLFETIKQFRKRGIRIEKIAIAKKPSPEIEDEFRVLGIDTVLV